MNGLKRAPVQVRTAGEQEVDNARNFSVRKGFAITNPLVGIDELIYEDRSFSNPFVAHCPTS